MSRGHPADRNLPTATTPTAACPPPPSPPFVAAAEAVPGLRFASLQKGLRAAEASIRHGLTDHSTALTNLAETAAAISRLDLVITIDSAVAHLVGALGKPTWLLLPSPQTGAGC